MPWYAKLLHMHGQPIGLLDRAIQIDSDGKLQGLLTSAEHERCQQFSDVFVFREGSEDASQPELALETSPQPAPQSVEEVFQEPVPVESETKPETEPAPAPTLPVVHKDAPVADEGPKPGFFSRRKKKQ